MTHERVPWLGVPKRLDDPVERDHAPAPAGVLDVHVHVFPSRLFEAVRAWFDDNAWDIRYRLDPGQVDEFLAERGVEQYVGLQYPHKPGMAADLNRWMLEFARQHPRCIPAASVLPGEPDAATVLDEALSAGARVVKLHSHVQCVAPDDERMFPLYERIEAHDALLVIHCGNAPALPGYACDVEALCSVEAFDRAMRRHPEMKVDVPHLGSGEIEGYFGLLDRYPHLYLDTAMMLAGYFEVEADVLGLVRRHWDRVLYGSDFPNVPYAWDRDLRALEQAGLSDEARAAVLGGNARALLGV